MTNFCYLHVLSMNWSTVKWFDMAFNILPDAKKSLIMTIYLSNNIQQWVPAGWLPNMQ